MSPSRPKRGRQKVLTPSLSTTLDSNKISNRTALTIVGETTKTLGHDVSSLALNRSSIRHNDNSIDKIKQNFHPDVVLIMRRDGKLLQDLTGKDKVDHLPVLVTSLDGSSQLLAIPKISAGKGSAQTNAVFNVLQDWKIQENIQRTFFDTTSFNTGRKTGACCLIEQLLRLDLFYLACRHHILKIVAGAAFTESMGPSSAPEVLLFKRFQAYWKFIDIDRYEDSSNDKLAAESIAEIKQELISFLNTALMEHQPCQDYRELLELTIIFLGTSPVRGVRFYAP